MLKNYIKITSRNLWKQKEYALINVLGLAMGLAGCIIILLYVMHELSYDKHHVHADRIYRVTSHIDFSQNYLEMATGPAPMGPTLKEIAPEVEEMVRLRPRGSYLVRSDDSNSNIKEQNMVFAGEAIFDVFTIPLLSGEAESALRRPNTIVISRSAAIRHFEQTDVVGETLVLDNHSRLEVTAVMEDMPVASHFHFDFLMSMSTIDEAENGIWLSNNFRTYLLLREGADVYAMGRYFETIKKTYIEPQLKQYMDITMAEFEEAGNSVEYRLQPLTDIHLYSNLDGEFEPNGSIVYVYIFSGLAIFVLVLACINFMNLATARSSQRAREVGIRKTLGSNRSRLAAQFLMESMLMSFMALFLGLLIVELALPFFSDLAGRTISVDYMSNPLLLLSIMGIVVLTGLLSGSYPAFVLSSLRPVQVLKGRFREEGNQNGLRKGLVVFQFSISIVIIVGLLVINKQLEFVQQKSLGFDKEQVIIVQDAYALGGLSAVENFKKQMLSYSAFTSGTISSFFPVEGYGRSDLTYWPKGVSPTAENTVNMQSWRVDEDYIETMGMEIVEGRNFSAERGADEHTVILNESAAKQFNFEDPVGEEISIFGFNSDGSINSDTLLHYTIIGIVKDFHYESLRQNITALGLFYQPTRGNIAFKITPSSATSALSFLREEWEKTAPAQPSSYSFLDQRFDQMYRAENRVQDLMTAFSILAIAIACLGLFGLSIYSVERKTKEIGIRKVMGATIPNMLVLMSGEFLKLIALSFIIAIPVSYFIMNWWLQDFAYRTQIGTGVFLVAGAGALLLALLTVSWQSVKAALMNPVESLRSE